MARQNAQHLFLTPETMAACTDFYEFTMAAGYFALGMDRQATFEMSVRRMPMHRSYMVFAGLEQALAFLQEARFSEEMVRFLRAQPALARAPREFFEYLRRFRFTGEVCAVPEGTVVFPGEPLLYVRAPIIEAQLVETFLLATINFQTAIASKAARVVQAAQLRPVADFGTRRAHGPQAGVLAARACYIGGCASTSNVLAAQQLGIPVSGTQAHSWIMAFEHETEAFARYAELYPEHAVMLVDTYDTIQGLRHAMTLGRRLKGVRLDSGNIIELSHRARRMLDKAGLRKVKIIASGDLDEWRIAEILRRHSPVDLFGVGTAMVTSRDDPAVSGVYKLVEVQRDGDMAPTIKLSRRKATCPRIKQVRRICDYTGKFRRDIVCLRDEPARGDPLLVEVMRGGRIVAPLPPLDEVRQRCRGQINRLPTKLRALDSKTRYPVLISPALQALAAQVGRTAGDGVTA